MSRAGACHRLQRESADATAGTRHARAACAATGGKAPGFAPQLAGGKSSRAQHGSSHCCQKRASDCPAHHSSSFLTGSNPAAGNFAGLRPPAFDTGLMCPIYLITVAPGIGCDEQNGLPDSMGKMHRQPLAHGLFTPQLPPQAKCFGSVRSWRAESVPAHSTAVTINAKDIFRRFVLI